MYKLNQLKQIAHGIAQQFGEDCEIVIHDLTKKKMESSIVYIENGHISHREIGDGPSRVVLDSVNDSNISDRYGYLTSTKDGRVLKSTTMYIRDEENHIQYILCINYDITVLSATVTSINSLISPSPTEDFKRNSTPEKIIQNVNDLLDDLIQQSVEKIGKPVAMMTKDDKVAAITFLNDAGAFLITKSSDKVSNYFGISKYTLYSYIDVNK